MMEMKLWGKRIGAVALSVALAAGLTACGGSKKDDGGAATAAPTVAATASMAPSAAPTAAPTQAAAAKTVYPLTLTDATGQSIVFEKAPERVITLAPSETEVVYAIGGGDTVVGVDQYSNYPKEANSKPKVGDMTTDIEGVVALKPDVVFAGASLNAKAIEALRKLNVKVYASEPKTFDQVVEKIETAGVILDRQEDAEKTANHMREEKARIVNAVKDLPKKKVYMEFSPGWSVGKGEFMDELVTLAGGENVAQDQQGWFEINAETIIKSNPDVILYTTGPGIGDAVKDAINKRPGFDSLAAVKENRMFALNEDIVSRVGPRLLDALVEMAKAIHPEAVK
ncbi:ABC transporter substrate-binding protein [Gorillibacterium massiliense]|uniref:ABC transporter substrate-binding protein n=1 Tax=Gorillibacterium massiliense TaxID=1280390 RepID=UPI0004BB95CC|nr:ABC transporter substrate-binding protein [Gorillibacterium massiliense]